MKQLILCALIAGAFLSGCGGLQDTWEGPGAETFHPKSIAVLPPMVGQYENAREPAQELLTASLKEQEPPYERVIDPDQVNTTIQNSEETADALVSYYSTLETLGQSNKEEAIMLGQALNSEALLVVKVNSWEYTRVEGDNVARAAFGLRLIDANEGTIVWKARHLEEESYIFFKPSLSDVAEDLAEEMIESMPH